MKQPKHILVIENDASFASAIEKSLRKESDDLMVASNPQTGLKLLGEHQYDLILLRLNLHASHA